MTSHVMEQFTRTTCACAECVQCCKDQPGCLIPGDMERIAAFLGKRVSEVKSLFWASRGAVAMDLATGRQFRIGTITPRLIRKRGCVFLTADGKCSIHAVAPAGCAYFDTHMNARTAQPISVAMGRLQMDEAYQALRAELPFADSYKPKSY